ncbi:MAG: hypothetical protein CM15mV13_1370 [uncultured marine virus]|nr:MAG: hypothetical protein CM15mV13_1370 [uncultured marine virus]
MDPMIEIAYLGAMLMLGVLAFKMMSQGWGAMANTKSDSYGSVMKAYGNKTHPEMRDVKDGEELMGINFTPDPEFLKKYKNGDYHLNQSLQDRIAEIEDEDEDDDDDGDIIVRV